MTDPAAALAQALRGALVAAGLERHELEGSVYFVEPQTEVDARIPMVLAHGVNDHAGTWAAVVPHLVGQYRLVVPDLAGHGESEPRDGPLDMGTIVSRLHAIIEHETAQPVVLVGNSMGAGVGILFSLAHPERVARLVLESGGGLDRPLGVPLVARTRDEAMIILRAVHGPHAVLPEWAVDALLKRASGSPMLRLVDEKGFRGQYVDRRLGEVNVPTTVIWGEHDGVVPRDYVEAIRDGIRGARLEIIAGAAHIPHLQQPERFVACLTSTS